MSTVPTYYFASLIGELAGMTVFKVSRWRSFALALVIGVFSLICFLASESEFADKGNIPFILLPGAIFLGWVCVTILVRDAKRSKLMLDADGLHWDHEFHPWTGIARYRGREYTGGHFILVTFKNRKPHKTTRSSRSIWSKVEEWGSVLDAWRDDVDLIIDTSRFDARNKTILGAMDRYFQAASGS